MIVFPNAKVNLGLHILNKRADGFHNLETVFVPVQLQDALEVVVANELSFTCSGNIIPGNESDNLCLQAYRLLAARYQLPPVHIHLHKKIPTGAGMGGGSADAAFTIKLLNEKFNLNIADSEMEILAAQLGSDCAFFIKNEPSFATGRGEILKPLSINLAAYKIVLVCPPVHVNTGWAYSQIVPRIPEKSLEEIILQPITNWRQDLINDFEQPVFTAHPQLLEIKNHLYSAGALYAAMSGSGSTLFGIFNKEATIKIEVANADVYYL